MISADEARALIRQRWQSDEWLAEKLEWLIDQDLRKNLFHLYAQGELEIAIPAFGVRKFDRELQSKYQAAGWLVSFGTTGDLHGNVISQTIIFRLTDEGSE